MNSSNELDRLLSAYRAACPDPEPSADFMPGLWRRIESRNHFAFRLRRWSQGVIAATAVACTLMIGVALTQATFGPESYVEALSDERDPENVVVSEANFQETSLISDLDDDRSLETFAQ
jgi:uncharacterized Fe-S cluster-containing radical SAM superfamily protein